MGTFTIRSHDSAQVQVAMYLGAATWLCHTITEIHRSQFYEAPIDQFSELPDLIQRTADRIADMISQGGDNKSNMFDALSYSIREVMRNLFEHSEAESLYYCAKYWPKSNKVEFAISDFGVGIRRGLAENPNFGSKRTRKRSSTACFRVFQEKPIYPDDQRHGSIRVAGFI